METYCRYHPLEHAGWHCLGCHRHLCNHCVAADAGAHAHCPVCQAVLRYTGSAADIEPFWQRLSDFFAYPVAKAPLALVSICTIVPAIAGDGLLGLIVGVFLLCAQTKYMYSIIETTQQGKMAPPTLSSAFSGGGLSLVLQQVVIFFVFFGLVFVAGIWLGQGAALLVLAFICLLFPACVMILATERRVSEAIDPNRLIGVIQGLGWPYFVMFGYLVLLLLGMGAVLSFVTDHFGAVLARTVTGFVTSYFFLVIFHMLGYLLFQYQHRLDSVITAADTGRPLERHVKEDKKFQIEIDIALKEGQYDVAIEALIVQFNRKPHDKLILDRLFKLLMLTQKWDLLDKKSRPVLALLLEAGRIREIRQMLRGLYKQRPEFEVRDPQLAFHLAQSLYHVGEYRLLLRILKDFGNRFKNATQEPEVLELSARTLANGLHNGSKAKMYLQYLAKEFPAHSLADKVPESLQSLEKSGRIPEPIAKFG